MTLHSYIPKEVRRSLWPIAAPVEPTGRLYRDQALADCCNGTQSIKYEVYRSMEETH